METVLAALDYAGCGGEVVAVAERLADKLGARLVLLSAWELPAEVPDALPLHGALEGETARHALEQDATSALQLLSAGARARELPVEVRVRRGAPAKVVLQTATEVGADWIVVGTHGRTGLKRLVLGSVAEQIVRHAEVPVVTVRSQHPEDHPGPTPVQQAVAAETNG